MCSKKTESSHVPALWVRKHVLPHAFNKTIFFTVNLWTHYPFTNIASTAINRPAIKPQSKISSNSSSCSHWTFITSHGPIMIGTIMGWRSIWQRDNRPILTSTCRGNLSNKQNAKCRDECIFSTTSLCLQLFMSSEVNKDGWLYNVPHRVTMVMSVLTDREKGDKVYWWQRASSIYSRDGGMLMECTAQQMGSVCV